MSCKNKDLRNYGEGPRASILVLKVRRAFRKLALVCHPDNRTSATRVDVGDDFRKVRGQLFALSSLNSPQLLLLDQVLR